MATPISANEVRHALRTCQRKLLTFVNHIVQSNQHINNNYVVSMATMADVIRHSPNTC
jgi:DNA topoisomerase VI subunit B